MEMNTAPSGNPLGADAAPTEIEGLLHKANTLLTAIDAADIELTTAQAIALAAAYATLATAKAELRQAQAQERMTELMALLLMNSSRPASICTGPVAD